MSRFRKTSVYNLIIAAIFTLLCVLACILFPYEEEEERQEATALLTSDLPLSTAAAAALIEANSGQVLFASNGNLLLPPASCGKILTALLTLDMTDLEEKTTISASAAAVGESSIYLREGEQLSIEDLLKGALVHSGNDACFALAEATAGSEPLFVHWLNLKAALLGAYSCHFVNTNGLPAEGHVISAIDLAMITATAMENAFFAETVGSKQTSFGENSSYRSYKNTNKLLWQNTNVVGVKTGTTDDAGPCLVAAYQDGAALFISVVFNSPDRYGESMRLLNWAADNYMLLRPLNAGDVIAYTPAQGLLAAQDDVFFLLPETDTQDIQVIWELPLQVRFVDKNGVQLGSTALIPAGNYNNAGE